MELEELGRKLTNLGGELCNSVYNLLEEFEKTHPVDTDVVFESLAVASASLLPVLAERLYKRLGEKQVKLLMDDFIDRWQGAITEAMRIVFENQISVVFVRKGENK